MKIQGPKNRLTAERDVSPRGGRLTFFVDGQRNAVDGLKFDTRVGQHLQLHGRQGEAFET